MRIAIVGGGLGGLAAALFLRKAGLDATVYEQAPELGAAQAIEDAFVLAGCLRTADRGSVRHALRRYEEIRRPPKPARSR